MNLVRKKQRLITSYLESCFISPERYGFCIMVTSKRLLKVRAKRGRDNHPRLCRLNLYLFVTNCLINEKDFTYIWTVAPLPFSRDNQSCDQWCSLLTLWERYDVFKMESSLSLPVPDMPSVMESPFVPEYREQMLKCASACVS